MPGFLFQPSGGLGPASQAEQEAGTSNQVAVTPGVQVYSASAAKAWVQLSTTGGAPSLITGFNVSSISDGGVGVFGINFGASFSSVNYGFASMGAHQPGVLATALYCGFTAGLTPTGGVFTLNTINISTSALADPTAPVAIAFFGDRN